MKTHEFLQLLEENKDTALLFEYAPNQLVSANYHLTEVKHLRIDSVDCGAGVDAWNETIIQLWESPSELGKTEYMSSYKALGILKKVGEMKPFDMQAEVKFEYGNALFHTAQLFVDHYAVQNRRLLLTLSVEKTDCKAKEACGVPVSANVSEAREAVTADECCTPGGGCC
jgi:hypothetical protein